MTKEAWLLVGVWATTGVAQTRREPSRGAVLTASGQPWVGATVRLLSRPLPGDERFGTPDEVEAASDGNGRFLAQLLPGRRYVAWAMQSLDEDHCVASLPVEDIVAGGPLERKAEAPATRKRLEFHGLAAWREHGAAVVTVMSTTTPRLVLHLTPEGEALRLPPLPGLRADLMVTVGGRPMSQWPKTIELKDPTPLVTKVAPPREVRVRILDVRNQRVQGARLFQRTIDLSDGGVLCSWRSASRMRRGTRW